MTTRRDVALAGFTGDTETARRALTHAEPAVRAAALGALDRLDELTDEQLTDALADPAAPVRLRAAELAATRPGVALADALDDADPLVAEMAAWACGERETTDDPTLARLVALATDHDEPLVREAAIAALGAIGDDRGLAAVLQGTGDKPAIRRRAVISLVAFDGPEVDAAIRRALDDRDWQVREAAEELLRDD